VEDITVISPVWKRTDNDVSSVFQDCDDRILKALYQVAGRDRGIRCFDGRRSMGDVCERDYELRNGFGSRVFLKLTVTSDEIRVQICPDMPVVKTLMYTLTFGLAGILAVLLHPDVRLRLYGEDIGASYTITMGIIVGLIIVVSLGMFIPDVGGALFHWSFPGVWTRTRSLADEIRNTADRALKREAPPSF